MINFKERILCSAIHYDNGKHYEIMDKYGISTGFIICGYRHSDIIHLLPTNVNILPIDNKLVNFEWNKNLNKHEITQGFITSNCHFVEREKAAEIAYECMQIDSPKKVLYSEDIY